MDKVDFLIIILGSSLGCIVYMLLNKYNILPDSLIKLMKNNKWQSVLISLILVILFGIILTDINIYMDSTYLLFMGFINSITSMILNS